MKYKIKFILLFILGFCTFCVLVYEKKMANKNDMKLFVENKEIILELGSSGEKIKLFNKEETDYLFLPSYLRDKENIYYDQDKYKVIVNGNEEEGRFEYQLNSATDIEIRDTSKNDTLFYKGSVTFMKSANLYTMYLNLKDGEKTDINNEEYIETSVRTIRVDGTTDFYGESQKVKERGNSLAETKKRPYGLKLSESVSLCGMEAGKKWALIANAYEGTHLTNKLTMDLAEKMGLQYTSQSDWVDLYINGEYQGNYLLCEKIEIDVNRVGITNLDESNEKCGDVSELQHFDEGRYKGYLYPKEPLKITGGYLIERDYYYDGDECGFYTESGQPFSIKGPKYASKNEVLYIQNVFQNIENLINQKDEKVYEYIDVDSFIKRYLIEEISFNMDSSLTSYNFYKDASADKIYAGPVWDYDCAYSEADGRASDYTDSVLVSSEDRGEDGPNILFWDSDLYEMTSYKNQIVQTYQQYYPYLLEVINDRIDLYAVKIDKSIQMDQILWDYAENSAGHYYDVNNNIRYLKYFLINRLNYLNEKWNISLEKLIPTTTNQLHTVSAYYEDQVIQFQVMDGACILDTDLPEYDNEKYSGWRYARDHKFLSEWIPVYEDIILYPNARG